MKQIIKQSLLATSFVVLMLAGAAPQAPLGITLVKDAAAIIGRPLTPLSFAGVARRTTRRAVVYGGAAYSSSAYSQQQATAQQQAATAQQQAVTAQQQAAVAQQQQAVAQQQAATAAGQARPAGAPPIGAVVSTLPKGCTPTTIKDVQYQACNGVYYRAAFQSNNLVYLVTQP